MSALNLTGSMVALVTPMKTDESVDWDALDSLVDWHVEQGTNAIVTVGTTGESATLSVEEHCDVIAAVVKRVNGRVPVIAGTGANSTREAISLTAEAKRLGADACLLVTPYYNKPTQQGLYEHFKLIAQSVDIPQILYNVPGRTVADLLPETVARLAPIANIIAIKEATGDISRGIQIMETCAQQLTLLSGDDGSFLELMKVGAKGNISVTANLAPAAMSQICALANAGDFDQAEALNSKLAGLHETLFVEANPIPVKWALAQLGKIGPAIRLPLTVLSEQYQPALRDSLKQAELI